MKKPGEYMQQGQDWMKGQFGIGSNSGGQVSGGQMNPMQKKQQQPEGNTVINIAGPAAPTNISQGGQAAGNLSGVQEQPENVWY